MEENVKVKKESFLKKFIRKIFRKKEKSEPIQEMSILEEPEETVSIDEEKPEEIMALEEPEPKSSESSGKSLVQVIEPIPEVKVEKIELKEEEKEIQKLEQEVRRARADLEKRLRDREGEIALKEELLERREKLLSKEEEKLVKRAMELKQTPELDQEVKKLLKILDDLLGKLPDDVIEEFTKSDDYKLYEKILDRYGVE